MSVFYPKSRRKYFEFLAKLAALEEKIYDETGTNIILIDYKIDHENAFEVLRRPGRMEEQIEAYWAMRLTSASMAAGMRAEEAGLDLNKIAGETIY